MCRCVAKGRCMLRPVIWHLCDVPMSWRLTFLARGIACYRVL